MDYFQELYLLNNLDGLESINYLTQNDRKIYEKLKKELENIESELKILVKKDKENWVTFYTLIKNIQDKKLWKIEGYKSFTSWLRTFCVQNKIHEATAWNRLAAGKTYEEYKKRQDNNGIETKDIKNIDVSMESLLIIKKIASSLDGQDQDTLIKKALNKELTTQDLRETYKIVREKKKSRNKEESSINSESNIIDAEQKMSAADIVSILIKPDWLKEIAFKEIDLNRKYFKSFADNNKYKAYTEFPVFTSSSQKSRRLDLLVVENITTDNVWNINIHGIEIKISKDDILKDHKYCEYTEFVNYFWLAVPEYLIETALENIFNGCGVISIKENNIEIIQKSNLLQPKLIKTTLSNIILKSI